MAIGVLLCPPQPGTTCGCPGWYLWSMGIGGQSSRGGGSASSRQVCGHRLGRAPLTPCFQLQPERGPVPPHRAMPDTAAVPHGSSTEPARRQHLSARPLPQLCITACPLPNTRRQPCRSSRCSGHQPQRCRTLPATANATAAQTQPAKGGSLLAPLSTHHTPELANFSCSPQIEDRDPASPGDVRRVPACPMPRAASEGGVTGGREAGADAGSRDQLGFELVATQRCWLVAPEPGHSPVPPPRPQSQAQRPRRAQLQGQAAFLG